MKTSKVKIEFKNDFEFRNEKFIFYYNNFLATFLHPESEPSLSAQPDLRALNHPAPCDRSALPGGRSPGTQGGEGPCVWEGRTALL